MLISAQTSYQPVIVVFATALAMALTATWAASGTLATLHTPEWFVAFSTCRLQVGRPVAIRDKPGRLRYLGKLTAFARMMRIVDGRGRRAGQDRYLFPMGSSI